MVPLFDVVVPVIYVHLGTLALLFLVIVYADHAAFSWIRGKRETLSPRFLRVTHTLVWAGLIVMILSGLLMAWPLRDYLITNLAFYVKAGFVLALFINAFFIGKHTRVASEHPFAALTPTEKRAILISGGVSTLAWVGAFVAALFMSTSHWLVHLFHGHVHH